MVEYSLDLQNINLSAIRTVRVLRPLKAINRVPSKSCFPLTHLSSACGRDMVNKPGCGGAVSAGFRYKMNRGFCRVCADFSPPLGQQVLLDGQENNKLPAYLPWSSFVHGHVDGTSGAEGEQYCSK